MAASSRRARFIAAPGSALRSTVAASSSGTSAGNRSYPELIIINRIIAIEFELQKYDRKVDEGVELSGHTLRARLAAENRLRLDLVALGLRPGAGGVPSPPNLTDVLASIAARRSETNEPEAAD